MIKHGKLIEEWDFQVKESWVHLLKANSILDLCPWKYKVDIYFKNNVDNTKIVDNTIDKIVYKGWYCESLRPHIVAQMI